MHTSPANQRRRQQARRRHQIRRRRVVALVVFVTLITFAVWVAYTIPGQTPARVPAGAAEPTFGRTAPPDEALVVARVEDVDVLLPVAQSVTTAVAFHPVDDSDAVAFSPVGKRLGGGDLGQKLAGIFAGTASCSTTSWTATAERNRPPRPASTWALSPGRRSSRRWTAR